MTDVNQGEIESSRNLLCTRILGDPAPVTHDSVAAYDHRKRREDFYLAYHAVAHHLTRNAVNADEREHDQHRVLRHNTRSTSIAVTKPPACGTST